MAPRKRPNVNSENQECNMSKKKTRGASLLKDLTKSIGNGNRLSVEFKRNGQVIGENRAKLSSYIGTVVKKWVPITVDDWRLVSQEQRDNIWQNVLHAFILPDNRKKWVLKKANTLWGTFKKDLGRLHMRDEETNELITEPPAMYDSYITQDQWTEFIRSRESKEFKVKSQKYRELAKQNKNSYRASRKGYVGVEEAYKAEHNMEATSDVSRAILWIEARKDKNGDICEEAMPVVEKLHHLMEQESSGALTTVGQKDVLALALNKMEHPGRVRGVGQDITIREHWPRSSKASSSKTLVEDETVISGLKEQIKAMEATFGSKISALENVIEKLVAERVEANEVRPPVEKHVVISPNDEVPRPQSGKASCSVLKKATIASEEIHPACELFWPDLNQIVAKGKLYSSSKDRGLLHCRPLECGYVKVEVVTLVKGDVQVPVPSVEVEFVKDAVGQFIAWPENLAIPTKTTAFENVEALKSKEGLKGLSSTYESVIGPTEIESEASTLEKYHWILDEFNGNKVRQIKVATGIFQYKHSDLDIGKEEIERLIDGKELGPSHVMLYIRYLFDMHCSRIKDKLKFICPTQVSLLGQSLEQRAKYVANCMEGNVQDMIFVAPYYFRYHWVLILMIPHMSSAYWIDPRHGKVENDAELLVSMSYKLKYAKMNKRTPRKQVLWHAIKCPLQQNMFDCGYYVLLFMRKVVFSQKQSSTIPSKWYDDKTTYKHHEVDEMRREWFDYFISLI